MVESIAVMRAGRGVFAALALLVLCGVCFGEAGDGASDAAARGGGGVTGVLSVTMLLGGLMVWVGAARVLMRRRWAAFDSVRLREGGMEEAGGARLAGELPGAVLVLCGLAVWLVQPVGSAVGMLLAGGSGDGGSAPADSLRGGVVASLGAYGASAVIIGAVSMMVPGLWRAIGAGLGGGGAGRSVLRIVRDGLAWGVLVGLAVYLVGAVSVGVARVMASWWGTAAPGEVAHSTLLKLVQPGEAGGLDVWWWGTVIGVTVGAPIIEEFIYRGFVQSGLLRLTKSGPVAIGLTSALFALQHWDAVAGHALVTLFVLSVGFGLALEKTGRLWVCVLMHAAFNAGNILMAML